MEMHQVRYFLAVCDAWNFTRAAEACHVAQPSLTKAIRKLEDEFGGPLFHRHRNKTILTELGHRVRPHLQALQSASEAARLDASSFLEAERSAIRLGVMSTIAPTRMTGFLSRLRDELPALELEVTEAPSRDLVQAMEEGRFDAALLAAPSLPEGLHAVPLYRERYVLAFPQGHPFSDRNDVPLGLLDGQDYLTRVHCEFPDHFRALGAAEPKGGQVRYSSEREDWVQAMVAAGLGCTIMPEYLPTHEGISTRPLSEPEVTRTVALVTVAGRRHGPALTAMLRLAKRYPWSGG